MSFSVTLYLLLSTGYFLKDRKSSRLSWLKNCWQGRKANTDDSQTVMENSVIPDQLASEPFMRHVHQSFLNHALLNKWLCKIHLYYPVSPVTQFSLWKRVHKLLWKQCCSWSAGIWTIYKTCILIEVHQNFLNHIIYIYWFSWQFSYTTGL